MGLIIYFALLLGIMAALTTVERWRNPGPTDWRMNLYSAVINVAISVIAIKYWPSWHGASLLDAHDGPLWLMLPLFLLTHDFFEWLYHYAQHRIPTLWAVHALHHSDPEMTTLTTNRHFWGDQLIKAVTIWSATSMVIRGSGGMALVYGMLSFYNFFIHANLKVDFGRLSWLLNCPAYHRRHHSLLPEHYDSNLAALFPIWDVIFGTYRRPDGWPPCGLDEGKPETVSELMTWPWHKRRTGEAEALLSEA